VWRIKQKKPQDEEIIILETEITEPLVQMDKIRKTMTYIEKKDLETDLSLKNGPLGFQVFSSEKRISKKQKTDIEEDELHEDDLLCEENIQTFKSPENKSKIKEFQTFGLKDSANLCTQLGAENLNVNARVSVFVDPSVLLSDLDQDLEINRKNVSTANVPY
jgi:hypothetical protein